jgi:hypothetical protein
MKVLKKGREQQGWSVEHLCTGTGNGGGGCKAELLVEIGDVFQTEQNCLHETDYFTTFRCPQCGVLTDLASVPGHVRDAAEAQRYRWHDPGAKSPTEELIEAVRDYCERYKTTMRTEVANFQAVLDRLAK